ncbi:MAG: ribosome silencing factor [Proteobacteria bacterium]|nr:ribosome silencing factor [Pseudomonadota bacterium]
MTNAHDLALQAVAAACSKSALDPVLLDVTEICPYTDFVLLLSGRSTRQVDAIAEAIEQDLKEHGHDLRGREGKRGGNWLLLDYGDLLVHVFQESHRGYYDLEGLWIDAERLPLATESPQRAAAEAR